MNFITDSRRNSEVKTPIRVADEDGRRWPEGRAPYFHLAGSLVNRQLILVEGQARGWTSRRNGIVSFNRSTAISSCHSTPALPLTGLPFSPSIRSTPLFPAVASLSLTCRFFRGPSFLSRFAESGSSYLVRSLTAYSLVPGLRRHYRWRALNVFCLFHLPRSLPSPCDEPLSPSFYPVRRSRCCRFNVDFLSGGFW